MAATRTLRPVRNQRVASPRTPPAPRFRRAKPADLPTVVRLVRAYYAFDGLRVDPAHTRATVAAVLRRPALAEIWLITLGRGIAGYFVLTACFSLEFGRESFVDELFLAAAHRGQGVGQAALAFIAETLRRRGVRVIHIVSESHNPAARRAYRRAGFDGAHRFLMSRELGPAAGG